MPEPAGVQSQEFSGVALSLHRDVCLKQLERVHAGRHVTRVVHFSTREECIRRLVSSTCGGIGRNGVVFRLTASRCGSRLKPLTEPTTMGYGRDMAEEQLSNAEASKKKRGSNPMVLTSRRTPHVVSVPCISTRLSMLPQRPSALGAEAWAGSMQQDPGFVTCLWQASLPDTLLSSIGRPNPQVFVLTRFVKLRTLDTAN